MCTRDHYESTFRSQRYIYLLTACLIIVGSMVLRSYSQATPRGVHCTKLVQVQVSAQKGY